MKKISGYVGVHVHASMFHKVKVDAVLLTRGSLQKAISNLFFVDETDCMQLYVDQEPDGGYYFPTSFE